jgi:hypothetical protein
MSYYTARYKPVQKAEKQYGSQNRKVLGGRPAVLYEARREFGAAYGLHNDFL